MSILIKDMEMPENGELLCIKIYPDGKVCIDLDLDCKQIATAVPVPKHGRLIDADRLETEFEKLVTQDNWYYNALHHAPTIIPADKDGCGRCDHCRINETGTCRYAEEGEI